MNPDSFQLTARVKRAAHTYAPGSWGPPTANHFIAADGGWRHPEPA